jgi:ribosomal-protein-alanine N-acetyltransferase
VPPGRSSATRASCCSATRPTSTPSAPPLPGLGIGRALLDWSLRATREGGAQALVLEVREDNARARSVYEAAGFQDIGRRPGYYPGPHGPVDARVMIREVAGD